MPNDRTEEILAHVAAHSPQYFDAERDSEDVTEEGKSSTGKKIAGVAAGVATNMIIGAITNVPGFVFGISKAVAGKVQATVHAKKVGKAQTAITVTAIRAEGLAEIRTEAKGLGHRVMAKSSMNPYLKCTLLLGGVDCTGEDAEKWSFKTPAHLGGGSTFAFKKDTIGTFGFESDLADMAMSALEVRVKDEPESRLFKNASGRETTIGTAIVALGQLVEAAMAAEGAASQEINVRLYRNEEVTDPKAEPTGGMVRLNILLQTKFVKETPETSE